MSMTEAAAVRNPSALATVPARAFTFGSHQVRVVLDEDGNPQWGGPGLAARPPTPDLGTPAGPGGAGSAAPP